MRLAWVIGSGGLLGTALRRTLHADDTKLFVPARPLDWSCHSRLEKQLIAYADEFAARTRQVESWEVYWAAGVGTMSSRDEDLRPETEAFDKLLSLLPALDRSPTACGAVALASSAGAIYAGSPDAVLTESTVSAPTTAYGRAKLAQENLLRTYVARRMNTVGLVARLSTLYGAGQSLGKNQGLISHIARCTLRNQPIRIYVPFDTIRDYITVNEAAPAMVDGLRRAQNTRAQRSPIPLDLQIIASEQPVTIAQLISVFRREMRHGPKVVTSTSRLTGIYPHSVQFRSIVAPARERRYRTSLSVGIAQVISAERQRYVAGEPDADAAANRNA